MHWLLKCFRKCDDMAKEIIVTADKVKNRKRFGKIVKISLLALLLFLIVVYIILQVIYNEGRFLITLDSNKTLESGIAIYETLDQPHAKRELSAGALSFMDNITWKWIPTTIDTEAEGTHNGQNYIAYTFYVENQGNRIMNYWYEVIVDDVIKGVDDAIRIMIYQNHEMTMYAKKNPLSGEAEKDTVAFLENKGDSIILEKRANFNPGDVDRYTIVIWLEGEDPECVDRIIGGAIKMHMNITEEHIEQ